MKNKVMAGIALVAITISGCSSGERDQDVDEAVMHEHYEGGEGGTTVEKTEEAMPYGQGYEHLTNKPPEVVAEAALERLGEATSQEVDSGEAVQRLNGVVTGALWSEIRSYPERVVPTATGTMWRDWDEAGGQAKASASMDSEQHPPDTDTSWARKYSLTRKLDGQDYELVDSYIVECTKVQGQWRVSDMQLLSTSTNSKN